MFKRTFDKTMEEVKRDIEQNKDIVIVDVRYYEEYQEGHLPKAVLLPLSELEENATKCLPKDKALYVYCRSGQRSTSAVTKLKAMGYMEVYNIGGIIHWPFEVEK